MPSAFALPTLICCLVSSVAASDAIAPGSALPGHGGYQLVNGPSLYSAPYTTSPMSSVFVLGDDVYVIPGAYFLSRGMHKSLTVTFPGFMPFSETTRSCLDHAAKPSEGCFGISFDFRTTLLFLQSSIADFDQTRPSFSNANPEHGPAGFEEYHIGPLDLRMDYYRKIRKNVNLALACSPYPKHTYTWPEGDCVTDFDYKPGVRITFRLPESRIADAERIEAGLMRLVRSFDKGGRQSVRGAANLQVRTFASEPPVFK